MAHDDTRMHGHNTPGMVGGRGHQHKEEPVRLDTRPEPGQAHPILNGDSAVPPGPDADTTTDRDQESALGGPVATHSSSVSDDQAH